MEGDNVFKSYSLTPYLALKFDFVNNQNAVVPTVQVNVMQGTESVVVRQVNEQG